MVTAPETPDEPADEAVAADEPTPEPAPEPAPLLTLRDGLPLVIETRDTLRRYCDLLAAGTGPVAIDAERASGYKYSNRAYLVQLRREGAGTALVDPIQFESLAPLSEALEGTEWILHAATQDLPCLAEIGLRPSRLFDTELAGRLLGKPRVGLATLVEEVVGLRMRKEHSAADWSTRPLPTSWLEYAALDVEVLLELREAMIEQLEAAGKTEWARQEFEALLSFQPTVREEVWRRTSGAHKLRGRRAQGAVRALWTARDQIAQERDVAPGRIIPDSALVAAASAMPETREALLAVPGFHGRGAARYARTWLDAIAEVRDLPEGELPGRAGPQRRSAAAARLGRTGPGRRPASRARAGGDDRAGRAARAAGREPAHARLPAPGALGAPGHPRGRRARGGGGRAAARVRRPRVADRPVPVRHRGGDPRGRCCSPKPAPTSCRRSSPQPTD